jgi:1-acyl-sn-glycerol-3-phosphate acyltransferase
MLMRTATLGRTPLEALAASDDHQPARGLSPRARVTRWLLRRVLEVFFTFEVRGLEHLPRGSYIVSANHPAWLETFALLVFLPTRYGLRMLASRAATFDHKWRRPFLDSADAVLPIDRHGNVDNRGMIRAAIEQLKGGISIGIFPEVLDHPPPPDGSLRPLQRGVALLARASGAPVVPVGLTDTRELWLKRRIRINVGQPLEPPRDRRDDDRFLADLAANIEALRPPAEPLPARRPWRWLSTLFK